MVVLQSLLETVRVASMGASSASRFLVRDNSERSFNAAIGALAFHTNTITLYPLIAILSCLTQAKVCGIVLLVRIYGPPTTTGAVSDRPVCLY